MTTQTLDRKPITIDDAIEALRPHLSPEFLKTYRRVTLALGFRQVGKAIAGLAPRSTATKPVKAALAPSHTLSEADNDYIMGLEAQLVEAETFFQCYPLLDTKALRTVVRRRKRAGVLAKGFTRDSVEQLVVSPSVAETLHRDNRPVEFDKKTGKWWADCEDQAWGQDIYLEELFGGQAGRPGHTEDDILPMLRKAQEHRQNLKWINSEIARAQREGV
jgi:hypothetical protein